MGPRGSSTPCAQPPSVQRVIEARIGPKKESPMPLLIRVPALAPAKHLVITTYSGDLYRASTRAWAAMPITRFSALLDDLIAGVAQSSCDVAPADP
jgi:hypothetical protein